MYTEDEIVISRNAVMKNCLGTVQCKNAFLKIIKHYHLKTNLYFFNKTMTNLNIHRNIETFHYQNSYTVFQRDMRIYARAVSGCRYLYLGAVSNITISSSTLEIHNLCQFDITDVIYILQMYCITVLNISAININY